MPRRRRRAWSGSAYATGAVNPIKFHVCRGCGLSVHGAIPPQCRDCGRMDFLTFGSKAEGTRFNQLRMLERAGEIRDLQIQPSFDLHAPGLNARPVKIGRCIADFKYTEAGEIVVEDVKRQIHTDLFRWKRKHVAAEYGINIRIVEV